MRRSKVLAKLRSGKVALGANTSLGASPITAGYAGKLGLDFAWLDMEHRWFTWQDTALLIYGCREGDIDAMVRVGGTDAPDFHLAIELGANGVMLPHCRSREAAAHAVDCTKYAPVGRRSKENVVIDAQFSLYPGDRYTQDVNKESFVVVQIEDAVAVEAAEEIISTPGVDAIFIGPAALTQQLGIPGEMTHPKYLAAEKKVADLCAKHGKAWGLPLAPTEDCIKSYIDKGARFLVPIGDFAAILRTWPKDVDTVRNVLAKNGLE